MHIDYIFVALLCLKQHFGAVSQGALGESAARVVPIFHSFAWVTVLEK